ncbi:MAG TPA: oligopeptide/dipeptide ABC transporter ATP-binding protein [Chloroflexota bacterium]|jgi:oligopeptide/dipeptide ABC transporter ATP-binding protein|nr:oligopeptide/dipeptide ABC transporter ATP-binding protein [Chloroflexota bacterium]
MADDALVRVDHLKKYFPVTKGLLLQRVVGHVQAVDDISFTINRGETLSLVGESGCGKTTTSKLILRLEKPTEGHIFLDDRDVHKLSGSELRQYHTDVQAVFQDPWSSLDPRMRVREIVSEPITVNERLSSKEVDERVQAMLVRVGLRPQQAGLYPHEFSGGQRQRVALAGALISNPKLIVLDEPVSALDVSVQAQIMNLLKALQDDFGTTFLLVAHNLATVRYLATNVAVMYLGQIVEKAETEELYERPLHPYTRALFSAALPAHPDIKREEIILPGEVPSPINPPSGCRFHPRCPEAMEICSQQIPINLEAAPGHWVACHLYGEGRPVPIPIDKKVDVSTNGTDSDAAVTEAAAT